MRSLGFCAVLDGFLRPIGASGSGMLVGGIQAGRDDSMDAFKGF